MTMPPHQVVAQHESPAEGAAPLEGRALALARAGWVVLTVIVLALNALAIPGAFTLHQSMCQPGAQCLSAQLTPADVRQLHQMGLSPVFLAAYQLAWDVATLLFDVAFAGSELGEPITARALAPATFDAARAAVVTANIVLPIMMGVCGALEWRQRHALSRAHASRAATSSRHGAA